MTTDGFLSQEMAESVRWTVASNPDDVTADDLAALLVRGTPPARRIAGRAYDELTAVRPDVADAVAAELEAVLHDDSEWRRHAATAVAGITESNPSACRRTIPPLVETVETSGGAERDRALLALHELAPHHPDEVRPAVPSMLAFLERTGERRESEEPRRPNDPFQAPPARESRDTGRAAAAETVVAVADEHPETVLDAVGRIEPLLSDSDASVRAAACDVANVIASERPAEARPLIDVLADLLLNDAKHPVPWKSAGALATLADSYPEDLVTEISCDVVAASELLSDSDRDVRRVGVTLLSYVGEYHPEAMGPVQDDLLNCLTDDDPGVRANAARALGDAGDVRAVDRVEAVARTDSEPDVQEVAAAAAAKVRDREGSSGADVEIHGGENG